MSRWKELAGLGGWVDGWETYLLSHQQGLVLPVQVVGAGRDVGPVWVGGWVSWVREQGQGWTDSSLAWGGSRWV